MRALLIALLMMGWASVSFAHQLNVFAYVKDDTVIVEAKFSTGKIPVSGEVRVHDAENELLVTLRLQKDGSVWFPLDLEVAQGGLLIEVETGEGHDNYWILTPDDIARGMAADEGGDQDGADDTEMTPEVENN